MGETVEELRRQLKEYERRMGIGEDDPAKDAYLVYVGLLRDQTDYLRGFKIKGYIASEEKGDQFAYKNAKDLWEGLPKMISSVSALKVELKMEGEKAKEVFKPISASSIANGEL